MADQLGVSNHLTARAGVYQYVRRMPKDVRSAFPSTGIQKSLGTRDQREARATALDLDRQWDERFNEARQRSGVAVGDFGPAVVSTADWTWPDWEALAAWFGASLAEEDWRAARCREGRCSRGRARSGRSALALGFHREGTHRPPAPIGGHFGRNLRGRTAPHRAEPRLPARHSDTVYGAWRAAAPPSRRAATATPASMPVPVLTPSENAPSAAQPTGRTLKDCRAKWIENRVKARKQVRADYLREMDATIALCDSRLRGPEAFPCPCRPEAIAWRSCPSSGPRRS